MYNFTRSMLQLFWMERREFKALTEVFNENEYKYRVFASNGSQVIIEIL